MHWPPNAGDDADPRHVFLDAHDGMARYGWGKTKGYQNLKDHSLVPAPVMTHPDRWRLDQLLAWEEKRMELAEAAEALVGPSREPLRIIDLLPSRNDDATRGERGAYARAAIRSMKLCTRTRASSTVAAIPITSSPSSART